MILYHLTPKKNLSTIWIFGLLCSHAKGKLKAVWLVPFSGIRKQRLRAAERHNCPTDDLALIVCKVKRSKVYKAGGGRFFTLEDVPASNLADASGVASVR